MTALRFPKRLSLGALPADFQEALRGLSANKLPADGSKPEKTIDVEVSFTAEHLGWVGSGDEEDVHRAVDAARQAQRSWAHVPFSERKAILLRFHDAVLKNRELLMDMVQLETGKNRASAFDEVMDVANNSRYYANNAEKILSPKRRRSAVPVLAKSRQHFQPVGVVGQISPWNYPLTLGISDALPALIAGNAVVAKPDSATPFTSLLVFGLLFEAGLPRDLVQLVTGSGRVVGSEIANTCDFLMFTGSTATGKILGATAGSRLIGFSAELGGKNPLIVAADAKMDYTVRGVVDACYSNSGQLCVSIERVYVERPVYEEFSAKFADAVRAMTLGPGFDWEVAMGSLASQQQLDTVTSYVDDAVAKGARVLAGGKARPDLGPYFYEPTVLADVPADAKLRTEEVFGPVVFVEVVDDLVAAVNAANDTVYGLNASVFASPETGHRIAPQIRAGSVSINDGYTAAWSAIDNTSGGMKDSGMGGRHGAAGLLKYTDSQNITEQRWMSMRGPESLGAKAYARIMSTALLAGKKLRMLP
ncbi:succinic semialdehyde dehydrogenase [Corynebacterium sp. HMSC22B11]|uniref:succinic semialdehyde dehydrogenase n=1 Tax=unclassified Corynebacterium TaxID=2624378 RepID=UPI0008A195D7|nr:MULTISPECIES: succinic semialdehyde dehydrogenase [unclassified Corynebacterium]MDK8790591.1 succinic semialdehyde dehydrogenase [Corynebacterium sp. MSK039]OFO14820.1 succinic semialdehyde dehydrogenase [Corynebacterium sp. HMSC22B11]